MGPSAGAAVEVTVVDGEVVVSMASHWSGTPDHPPVFIHVLFSEPPASLYPVWQEKEQTAPGWKLFSFNLHVLGMTLE